MKVLVAYFSFTGSTRVVAEAIAGELEADLLRIETVKDLGVKVTPSSMFWLGFQSLFRRKPALKPFDKTPSDYDVIFVGTPVWVNTLSSPVRSFLDQITVSGKKVALFATYGSKAGGSLKSMGKLLEGNEILGQMGFPEAKDEEGKAANKKMACDWVCELILS